MLKVIKIGGNVIDNPAKLSAFLESFSALEGDKILIHGGGKIATSIAASLGIESRMIEGRRVTDAETLKVVTMVYAGLINKGIVASLQGLGVNAIGLCGADGGLIKSVRRSAVPVDYGFVGDPDVSEFGVSTARTLIDAGLVPIIAPITMDASGTLLNTNADTVAQTVAVALSSIYDVELVYCFEKRGVLRDASDDSTVIDRIDRPTFDSLRAEGIIADGMIPKLENAFKAIASGVCRVSICSSDALMQPGYGGTTLQ